MENVLVADEVLVEPIITYERKFKINRLFSPDPELVLSHMDLYKGIKILDIGCGAGKLLSTIAELLDGCELVGIDIQAKAIELAQKFTVKGIEFKTADAAKLPFQKDSFDYVICTNAFYYIENKGRALMEMYRVLKTGGRLLLLEGIVGTTFKAKLDKIMRQSPFIKFSRKFLKRTTLLRKSYLISAVK